MRDKEIEIHFPGRLYRVKMGGYGGYIFCNDANQYYFYLVAQKAIERCSKTPLFAQAR